MKFYLATFIITCFYIETIKPNEQPCCNGTNLIKGKLCVDGSKLNTPCPNVYLTHEPTKLPSYEEYCVARFVNRTTDSYLVCFVEEDERDWKFQIYPIFELFSVFFIALTIVIYASLPNIRDLQGIITLHAITGLGISYTTLAIIQLAQYVNNMYCTLSAYVVYFFSLYAFLWLNLLSFHTWRLAVKPKILKNIKKWLQIYHIYGIGLALALLIIVIISHQVSDKSSSTHPGFGETNCWFKSNEAQIVYFYIPISILFSLNILYFGWAIVVLWKDISRCDEKSMKIMKFRTKLSLKLFIVMGITWIFEVLSGIFQEVHIAMKVWWVIMDIVNCMQGFLIFLVLVVFRKKVIREIANTTLCGKYFPNNWKTLKDDECDDVIEEYVMNENSNKA